MSEIYFDYSRLGRATNHTCRRQISGGQVRGTELTQPLLVFVLPFDAIILCGTITVSFK